MQTRKINFKKHIKKDDDYLTNTVPLWEKTNLTLQEAAAYSGVGINKLRTITNAEDCPFVLFVGRKRLIKCKGLDAYLERSYSI